MFPTQNEVLAYATESTKKMVQFVEEHFRVSKFPLETKFSFNMNSKHARACGGVQFGRPFINVNLREYLADIYGMLEYARFGTHPIIGHVRSNDWKVCLDTVLAHEISHAVQYWAPDRTSYMFACKNDRPHGYLFQSIYMIMRKKFINDRVDTIGIPPVRSGTPKDASDDVAKIMHDLRVAPSKFYGKEFNCPKYGRAKIISYNPRKSKYPYVAMTNRGTVNYGAGYLASLLVKEVGQNTPTAPVTPTAPITPPAAPKSAEAIMLTKADVTANRIIGRQVKTPLGIMNVIDFVTRNYKFPYVLRAANDKTYRVSRDQLASWAVAA